MGYTTNTGLRLYRFQRDSVLLWLGQSEGQECL